MRFVCDEMLGVLARDLRLLGYDTRYMKDVDDDEVLAAALDDGRVLLTRDRDLSARAGEHGVLVRSLDPSEQLAQVVDELALRPTDAQFLSRCTDCNGVLQRMPSADAADELPPTVPDEHDEVQRCTSCGHLYWDGSHVADIRRRLGQYVAVDDRRRTGTDT